MTRDDQGRGGLHRLIYASRFTGAERDLDEVLRVVVAKSIQNNRLDDVTGFLVAGEGRFLQLLEGPAKAVEAVYDRIGEDPRHTEARQDRQRSGRSSAVPRLEHGPAPPRLGRPVPAFRDRPGDFRSRQPGRRPRCEAADRRGRSSPALSGPSRRSASPMPCRTPTAPPCRRARTSPACGSFR
ncbi:BLUF domain-containing protein [Caulobacter segnis]